MPTTATAPARSAGERLDLYGLRDDLARSYAPANAHERMLVLQIAQSFVRLQRAQDAEARYFEQKDILEAIATDFNTYKAITRYVSECERAWRHAVLFLEKTQRRRTKDERTNRPATAPEGQPEPNEPLAESALAATGRAATDSGDSSLATHYYPRPLRKMANPNRNRHLEQALSPRTNQPPPSPATRHYRRNTN